MLCSVFAGIENSSKQEFLLKNRKIYGEMGSGAKIKIQRTYQKLGLLEKEMGNFILFEVGNI